MSNINFALVACAVALATWSPARGAEAAEPLRVLSQGPGVLHRADSTVQFVVHSQRVGKDFLIQVTPPVSGPWLPGQRAPVAYVLDGGYGIFGPSARLMGGSRAMLPAYVVTIAYAPGQRGSREQDMLFSNATRPDGSAVTGGGGEGFIAFLADELRPFVEAKYPVDPTRSVLVGHSLAGIFTANVLARRPDAFAGYLIASPSLWADPAVADSLARAKSAGAPRRVFVAYGGAEAPHMVTGGRRIADAVARNRAAFTSRSQVFPNADHISYYPELVACGLGYLLPQTHPVTYYGIIKRSVEALRPYEGAYVLADGRRLEVALKADRLTTTLASPVELLATPEPSRFSVEGYNAQLSFEGRPGEAPDLLRIILNGDEAIARRAAD